MLWLSGVVACSRLATESVDAYKLPEPLECGGQWCGALLTINSERDQPDGGRTRAESLYSTR